MTSTRTLHDALLAELADVLERAAAAHARIDKLLEEGHAAHLDVRRRLARLDQAELERAHNDRLRTIWLSLVAIVGAALLLFAAVRGS